MHTEDEAKKMWCPHVVASHSDPRRVSKYDSDGKHSLSDTVAGAPGNNCIASKCMAWRWLRETPIRGLTAAAESETGIMTKSSDPESPRLGYCGLAGKP